MLRQLFHSLSNEPRIFAFVRANRLARSFANRFVAGETIASALAAVRELNAKGITATLDLLGESVHTEAEARSQQREYLALLDALHAEGLDANVSLKLTAMGLDIGEELCVDLMRGILDRARAHATFVRLDMESSAYTERTLRLFEDRLHPGWREHVGIVLQSYLRRTSADVERAIEQHARVRLCKGAYQEPATVAFPDKADVDRTYVQCMERLLSAGHYPGLATHDEAILEAAKRHVAKHAIGRDRFEFQLLYGVRRDLQERLVKEGYRVRVYVPFGTQWYPYLMRRLAERPANVAFITGNVIKEMIGGVR